MCLLVCAWRVVPGIPLLVLANRDEFFARPSAPLQRWEDGLLAGRDLQGGGTWLGVRGRRFAALTNVREPGQSPPPQAPSRGELVPSFLRGAASAEAWISEQSPHRYAGFNLLVSDGEKLVWSSNRAGGDPRVLGPGVYGLSNAALDTPWPKLVRLRAELERFLGAGPSLGTPSLSARAPGERAPQPTSGPNPRGDTPASACVPPEPARPQGFDPQAAVSAARSARLVGADVPTRLLSLLADESRPPDAELPTTGVGLELERVLSPIRVRGERYGTRCSTLVIVSAEQTEIWEQTYDAAGGCGPRSYAAQGSGAASLPGQGLVVPLHPAPREDQ